MDYYLDAFRNYFTFSGRATRTAYWIFTLIHIVISIALVGLGTVTGLIFLGALYNLVMIIPNLSYGARRLHDMGRSGWWQLLYILPIIGPLILLVMLVMPSKDDNKFGPNPHKTDNSEQGTVKEKKEIEHDENAEGEKAE